MVRPATMEPTVSKSSSPRKLCFSSGVLPTLAWCPLALRSAAAAAAAAAAAKRVACSHSSAAAAASACSASRSTGRGGVRSCLTCTCVAGLDGSGLTCTSAFVWAGLRSASAGAEGLEAAITPSAARLSTCRVHRATLPSMSPG